MYKKGPASKAGLLIGDKIISIGKETIIGYDNDKVYSILRENSGRHVKVTVSRNKNILNFKIKRGNVFLPSIDTYYKLNDTIGYISVNRFSETTMREFSDAFSKMKKIKVLMLDMRGNVGGAISEAIKLSNFFLKKGTLLGSVKGKSVPVQQYISANDSQFDGKLIVLSDENSASACELFLGAVQDWDRAVIVGRRSFGKAMILQSFSLSDGSMIEVTQTYNYTPSGRTIQRHYEKHKKEDYNNEILKRFSENFIDSIDYKSSEYKTLRLGRSVYGDGGIFPDFYVKHPDSILNSYTFELVKNSIFDTYVGIYVGKNRAELLRKYPSFQSFNKSFIVTSQIIEEIVKYAEEKGIPCDTIRLKKTENYIKIRLKAMIAKALWDKKEAFMVFESFDPDIKRALEVLDNWDELICLRSQIW